MIMVGYVVYVCPGPHLPYFPYIFIFSLVLRYGLEGEEREEERNGEGEDV